MACQMRALDRSEWRIFKSLRLHALQTEPGVFAASYGAEAAYGEHRWRETVQGPGHQVFGLFDDQKLIGITAAFTWREDPCGETAILAMSFLLPEYRGRGLSRLLYDARLDWIRAQPQFKRVVVSHRDSNEISRRANQKYGFSVFQRAARQWPDGQVADEIFYELKIPRS